MYKFRLTKIILIVALLVIPIVLLLLPADYFDNGESLCPSKRFLDLECLGCGITRSIMHLLHLEFSNAWIYNKLSFIVLPVGMFYWVKWLRKTWLDLRESA
jgi:hypothetical protein